MNFTTPEFFLFLPAVLLIYVFVFHREHARDTFLLVASYVFYMSWNWQYAGLIAFSTLVDYTVGLKLEKAQGDKTRKGLLLISLCVNLGLLAVFKYFNFFMDSLGDLAGVFGWSLDVPVLRVLLPVGISFYTFQTLSYSIDLYRRKIPVERSLLKFALFVSFFPQLVAGPIVRASEFLPQLRREPNVNERRFHSGLLLVFRGLIKKCLFADLLAVLVVDAVFQNPGDFSSWDLMLALYGYTFQIYNDFSGYSDIAIGIGKMLGFDLPKNFNRPYYARNVREFWSRWHISLSTWLRDYLYIPLGGNRGTKARVTRNLMITMLLGGLWHGAALNFILWGGYHGLLLVLARGQSRSDMPAPLRVRLRQRFVCFHLVVLGWLFFRIQSGAGPDGVLRGRGGAGLHVPHPSRLLRGARGGHRGPLHLASDPRQPQPTLRLPAGARARRGLRRPDPGHHRPLRGRPELHLLPVLGGAWEGLSTELAEDRLLLDLGVVREQERLAQDQSQRVVPFEG